MLGAWTVLIFTTAAPSLSTRSVKLGKSPVCAETAVDKPNNATRKNLSIILYLSSENKTARWSEVSKNIYARALRATYGEL
jgi:hypothetical protein